GGRGDLVYAGTGNAAGPLTLEATAVGEATLLSEIGRLMETAEQGRARYVALADRVSRLYAPVVHLLALATFVGWELLSPVPWQQAMLFAVSVLIITCPCALGLAVPAVQVIASGRLFRLGVLLKSGTALERLGTVDTVVFDKTGTLTRGSLTLRDRPGDGEALRLAASMAARSRHPLAKALVRAVPDVAPAEDVREVAGQGLVLDTPRGEIRLGSRRFCGVVESPDESDGPELWLTRPGAAPLRLAFADTLRPDAIQVISHLKKSGYIVELLSGDRESVTRPLAAALGIERWQAGCTPADKLRRLEALKAEGRRVLMVGDGLNDAPALAAATVSLSPTTAADITQTAADTVFQGERLSPVLAVLAVARRAQGLVRQNFRFAFVYNALMVPLAVAGLVTPLIAAAAMSASSILVIANALRLGRMRLPGGRP
ncbi:MAG: heavy metal translocating P-type ATPase, partial [Rhodospirillaceae bacterium]|nr:heavy metal translocating P-type ATPase [Rhodospirillaceae bacterium]